MQPGPRVRGRWGNNLRECNLPPSTSSPQDGGFRIVPPFKLEPFWAFSVGRLMPSREDPIKRAQPKRKEQDR
jgi:hypothetical protein